MAPTAVGHMVEALATANGYKRANPELDVHLLVNERTAVELAGCCPWLGGVHAVDREAPRFDRVPSEWDYVIHDDRRPSKVAADYLVRARSHLLGRVATGTLGDHTLPFDRRPSLRRDLPADAGGASSGSARAAERRSR